MISPNAASARSFMAPSLGSNTINGWVLPSPACAITEIITCRSAAICAIPVTRSPSRGSGTPTSSSSSVPLASTAGIAYRRAATNASPSSGSSVEKTSVAPFSANNAAITPASSPADAPRSSEPAITSAAASRSRPIFSLSSTAFTATESMNSSIDGRIRLDTASTPLTAASSDAKVATTVLDRCCLGSSRSVISVTTPSVPSLPTNNLVRLSPATSLRRGPPSRTAVPSASTTCRPST